MLVCWYVCRYVLRGLRMPRCQLPLWSIAQLGNTPAGAPLPPPVGALGCQPPIEALGCPPLLGATSSIATLSLYYIDIIHCRSTVRWINRIFIQTRFYNMCVKSKAI